MLLLEAEVLAFLIHGKKKFHVEFSFARRIESHQKIFVMKIVVSLFMALGRNVSHK